MTIFMACRIEGGNEVEARNLEPQKCGGWHWVGWDEMRADWERKNEVGNEKARRKLFRPLYDLFEQRDGFSLDSL